VYLVELYENVELRSRERFRQVDGTNVTEAPAPARLDCRYLISGWSPTTANALVDPAVDEALLLYQVAQVLFEAMPLDANAIYAPGTPPATFPDEMLHPPLPVVVAPEEPFPKLPDFWLRMDTIWKPVVDLIVTLPVVYEPREAGAAVTTLFGEYGLPGAPSLDEVIAVGGVVRLTSSDAVPGAWVRLVELDRLTTTNAAGQFIFTGIRRGTYTFETGAPGHPAVTHTLDVPTLTGTYDLELP
jgi:uncharacterized protein DUF4255/carboxypeptidase family protein